MMWKHAFMGTLCECEKLYFIHGLKSNREEFALVTAQNDVHGGEQC